MDLIYTIKSIYTFSKHSYNFLQILDEPINLIENIYLGNFYHITNSVIIRDYNFKFIINMSKNNLDQPNFDKNFLFFDEDIKLELESIENIKIKFEPVINFIIKSQTYVDSKSDSNTNIIIYSNQKKYLIIVLFILLKTKYNLSYNRIINLLSFKKIIFHDEITQELIEILEKL